MAYAERERAKWCTLQQAIAHICSADGCDQDAAKTQLRKALAGGAVGVLQWKGGRPKATVGGDTVQVDRPPIRDQRWTDVDIDWEAGTVLDVWGKTGPRHRVLFVRRLALQKHWPPMHPPADWNDPGRYEIQGARLARKSREEREAQEAAWQAAWDAERGKPMDERRYFAFQELAESMARDPHTLLVDSALRDRILNDLTDWTRRQQFDLARADVVTLSGAPPEFRPLSPLLPTAIVANPEMLMLGRDACRRYIEANANMPNAAGSPRTWFRDAAGLERNVARNSAIPAEPTGAEEELRHAPHARINEAIRAVYDHAKSIGEKAPNLNEIVGPVQAMLRDGGFSATGRRIRTLADAKQFQGYRLKQGHHWSRGRKKASR